MIPIEDLRARIGLGADDNSQDDALITADAVATAMLEAWLDRKLMLAPETETLTHWSGRTASLRRYPLTPASVAVTGWDAAFHTDDELGLVHFDWRGWRGEPHRFTIAYEGGYAVLPPALYAVAMLVFDDVWRALGSDGPDQGGGQTGDIRSIAIPDVGTIQYASAGGDAAPTLPGLSYGIPAQYAGIIDLYRRQHA